ncbi:SurA N-terminal domain-containing protein, partial [Burkholderia pseudomallei]
MKKTLRFAAVASGLVASLITVAPSASAQALRAQGASLADEVVAVVNNDVITGRELDQRVGLIARRLQQQKAPVPPTDQLRAQVLNQMVLERIQVQRAKDDGIVVDNATVQATLGRLAQANGMQLDQYKARIEAQGVPWDLFVRDARTELMLSKLREKEV